MNLNDILDEIYVVNLDERQDRLNNIKYQFSELGTQFTRISATKDKNGTLGNKKSWLRILQMAIRKGQQTIGICEDDVVFRYQLLKDLPVLAPMINETDFEVLSMHHYCEQAGKASNRMNLPEEDLSLIKVRRKPWCNQMLMLRNLAKWSNQIRRSIIKQPNRSLDNTITVFDAKAYITSREYAFQLDDYSSIKKKNMRRFKQKLRYKDIIHDT